jgi:hypothetical protein
MSLRDMVWLGYEYGQSADLYHIGRHGCAVAGSGGVWFVLKPRLCGRLNGDKMEQIEIVLRRATDDPPEDDPKFQEELSVRPKRS